MLKLRKVLIANRGEIACRIIRTARRLGLATVAVHSDADAAAMHVAMADQAVHIGPSPATESYLRTDRILAAAEATGADCIHPGYGFLSENADFAAAVIAAGLEFIGPSPDAMRRMGGKDAAKAIAEAAGVPVVPGYRGEQQDARTLAREAARIGYPVLIKAVAGGGGRGMRLVERVEDMEAALDSAVREARSAFGDGRVLLEKLIVRPRHVEVQVFGDSHGNVVHLFERDCTLQRRNQKVIEEAPAPGMSEALRQNITEAAVTCARAVEYKGAGTVEFLVEGGALGPAAPWYFIEMNTRLQVEHPVTEAITGLDLVEWQLRAAAGERLPLTQEQIGLQGHAVEVRLCAEDPAQGFIPSTGRMAAFEMPTGVRVDTGVAAGDTVSPFYDSMIAKVIAHGPDRAATCRRLMDALDRLVVAGPRTNAAFLRALIDHPDVRAERMDTGLIGRDLARLTAHKPRRQAVLEGARALVEMEQRRYGGSPAPASPWDALDGFQLGGERRMSRRMTVDGRDHRFDFVWHGCGSTAFATTCEPWPGLAAEVTDRPVQVRAQGARVLVLDDLVQHEIGWPDYAVDPAAAAAGDGAVRAPITGKVAKLLVKKGEAVEKGARIAVVEAMKMEHVLHAGIAGVVEKIAAAEGQQVAQGALIAVIASPSPASAAGKARG